jgi:hypothetical protein
MSQKPKKAEHFLAINPRLQKGTQSNYPAKSTKLQTLQFAIQW